MDNRDIIISNDLRSAVDPALENHLLHAWCPQGSCRFVFNSYQRDFDSGPDRDASYIYGPTLPRTAFLNLRLSI